MEIDGAALARLASRPPFHTVPEAHVCDHSVEIQLPLLLKAAPGVPVTPLYVGAMTADERRAAARALAELAGPGDVFLASSDLTHYGRSFGYQPFPPDEDAPHRLKELDEGVIEAAGSVDASFFLDHIAATRTTVCGFEPIALLLETLALSPDEVFQDTLDYQTSGEITGDYRHSVSYASLGYFHVGSLSLDGEDQAALLESARQTLARMFKTGKRTPRPPEGGGTSLRRRAGVFVSLHQDGCLRGCVGHKSGRERLTAAVPLLALSAALDDPRFKPLRACETDIRDRNLHSEPAQARPRWRALPDWLARGLYRVRVRAGTAAAAGGRRPRLVRRNVSWTPWRRRRVYRRAPGARPGVRLYLFQSQVFARKLRPCRGGLAEGAKKNLYDYGHLGPKGV